MMEAQMAALAHVRGLEANPRNILEAGRLFGDEAARWAFGQWELRRRASVKFARAAEMLFTRDGLEMASGEPAAALHAGLFQAGEVMDAACGIGGDLLALAARGVASGFDLSPEHLACAAHNLRVHRLSATLRQADSTLEDWSGRQVWVDPMRRGGGIRGRDPELHSPPMSRIEELAAGSRLTWVKLSPLTRDDGLRAGERPVLFLSLGRECREALVGLGREAPEPGGWAWHGESGERLPSGIDPTRTASALAWIHEADPAAIRADALAGFGMENLGDAPGWLTGPGEIDSVWLRSFEVLWQGPARLKEVQGAGRDLGLACVAVKTRGVQERPEDWQKRLKKLEGQPAVLMLWASGSRQRAAWAKFSVAFSAHERQWRASDQRPR